jgi:hypothetical protein
MTHQSWGAIKPLRYVVELAGGCCGGCVFVFARPPNQQSTYLFFVEFLF